jgi:polyferredoxin
MFYSGVRHIVDRPIRFAVFHSPCEQAWLIIHHSKNGAKSRLQQARVVKVRFITWSVIVVLTLAIWLFFYYASEPLSGRGTAVIAGFSVAIVYGARWLGRTLTKRKGRK